MTTIPFEVKDLEFFTLGTQTMYLAEDRLLFDKIDYQDISFMITNETSDGYFKVALTADVLKMLGFTKWMDLVLTLRLSPYVIAYDLNRELLSILNEEDIVLQIKCSYLHTLQALVYHCTGTKLLIENK